MGTKIHSDVARVQCAVTSTRSVAAQTRKTNSATPGIPVGNIVNSLCTVESLRLSESPDNLDWIVPPYPFGECIR